jgi:hypothetical protein
VVVRRYLLSHIRLMQNNPYVFESMPGVVAQSREWDQLHGYLTKFGPHKIVAGDYGKFDKRMTAPFILAAFDVLVQMSRAAGWSEGDLMYIRCIAQDVAFPAIDFNGDLMEFQCNPSGHPLTVVINCIVNCLYMRYAFRLCANKPLSEFKQHVNLATYGDDNIMGVSDDCPNFHHTRIATAMSLIGVEYTMAEKEAVSVPYIHINDASFLKRKFVFDKDIGSIVAPLDHESIDKMLTNFVDRKVISPRAHDVCVVETALREYFYYGKEKFDERVLFFEKLIKDCDLTNYVEDSTFPKYGDMVYAFWARFGDLENARAHSDPYPKTPELAIQEG